MPTLLLMRHAKSDWGGADVPDHDRPLNERGKRDAPRMGRWLAAQRVAPTRIVTSSARRARKTADRVVEGLRTPVPIELRDDLYHAPLERWLLVLTRLPAEAECVLCIGHNPGLEALIERLLGRHEPMPTAAIACLTVGPAGWTTFQDERPDVSLRALWRPKELDADDGA